MIPEAEVNAYRIQCVCQGDPEMEVLMQIHHLGEQGLRLGQQEWYRCVTKYDGEERAQG